MAQSVIIYNLVLSITMFYYQRVSLFPKGIKIPKIGPLLGFVFGQAKSQTVSWSKKHWIFILEQT